MVPEEAFAPFRDAFPPFPPFHDASPCVCTYDLTIPHCLRGLQKACYFGFFDFNKFDVQEYEHYEQVENGDLNWIVEKKFLAFAGPHRRSEMTAEGYRTLTPRNYIPYFKKHNVTLVVRLNKKYYDEQLFVEAGIAHVEAYFVDGSIPPPNVLRQFLAACEATPGGVAVHCKAGLGRTGTCIGCYIMKHYGFSAAEVIGWMRICRPGSVIGPQQHYLERMEGPMHREGDAFRRIHENSTQRGGDKGEAGHSRFSAATSRPVSSLSETVTRKCIEIPGDTELGRPDSRQGAEKDGDVHGSSSPRSQRAPGAPPLCSPQFYASGSPSRSSHGSHAMSSRLHPDRQSGSEVNTRDFPAEGHDASSKQHSRRSYARAYPLHAERVARALRGELTRFSMREAEMTTGRPLTPRCHQGTARRASLPSESSGTTGKRMTARRTSGTPKTSSPAAKAGPGARRISNATVSLTAVAEQAMAAASFASAGKEQSRQHTRSVVPSARTSTVSNTPDATEDGARWGERLGRTQGDRLREQRATRRRGGTPLGR